MKNSLILVGIIVIYVVIGGIANEVGLTEPLVGQFGTPQAPAGGGGWLDTITSILAPLTWAFNAVGGLFQLATYQADVPVLVNSLILIPMGSILVFTGINIVRGR